VDRSPGFVTLVAQISEQEHGGHGAEAAGGDEQARAAAGDLELALQALHGAAQERARHRLAHHRGVEDGQEAAPVAAHAQRHRIAFSFAHWPTPHPGARVLSARLLIAALRDVTPLDIDLIR